MFLLRVDVGQLHDPALGEPRIPRGIPGVLYKLTRSRFSVCKLGEECTSDLEWRLCDCAREIRRRWGRTGNPRGRRTRWTAMRV